MFFLRKGIHFLKSLAKAHISYDADISGRKRFKKIQTLYKDPNKTLKGDLCC